MTTPELSLNERLAIEFGHADKAGREEYYWRAELGCWDAYPSNYESDNLAAFALLEKAKQDGKIFGCDLALGFQLYSCTIYTEKNGVVPYISVEETLSKAITQALAQLLDK